VTPHSKKPCHAAAEFDAWNHGGGFLPLAMQARHRLDIKNFAKIFRFPVISNI
jgi:hypothetical protein